MTFFTLYPPIYIMPGHPGPAFGRPKCKLVPGIHLFKLPFKRRG
jgi:hypothetical protein